MLRLGVISELGSGEHLGFARVSFDEVGMVSGWLSLPSLGTKTVKIWYPIAINSQVACLMDDICEQGVIVAALWSKTDMPPKWAKENIIGIKFSDGVNVLYDSKEQKLIIDAPDSDINMTCKTLNLTGDLHLSGDQTVSGDVTAKGEVTSGVIKLTQHKHPTPSGVSGIPTP